ncbi:MAG: hypothetical protein H8K08_11975 [Nitrospira sp.]|nr:hypothetical protein [Nitrospira sp.]
MKPRGLLVVDAEGQELLLTSEKQKHRDRYTLFILEHTGNGWFQVSPKKADTLRSGLLGALFEYFGNLCRILDEATAPPRGQARTVSQRTTFIPTKRRKRSDSLPKAHWQ